jgi:hypothetical protein
VCPCVEEQWFATNILWWGSQPAIHPSLPFIQHSTREDGRKTTSVSTQDKFSKVLILKKLPK